MDDMHPVVAKGRAIPGHELELSEHEGSKHRNRRQMYGEQPHLLDALRDNSSISKDQTTGNNFDRLIPLDRNEDVEGKYNAPTGKHPRTSKLGVDRNAEPSARGLRYQIRYPKKLLPPPPESLSEWETDEERIEDSEYDAYARPRHQHQSPSKRSRSIHHGFEATMHSRRRSRVSTRKPLHAYAVGDDDMDVTFLRKSSKSRSSSSAYEKEIPRDGDSQFMKDRAQFDGDCGKLTLTPQPARNPKVEDLLEELDKLQHENEQLRSRVRGTSPPPAVPAYSHKFFYCIDQTMYLDEPRWEPGDRSPILRSSNPLSRGVDHYLEQHPELAFVFYKYYHSRAPASKTKIETKDGVFRAPVPIQQTLCFVSSHMVAAVEKFVSEVPDFGEYFPDFDPLDDAHAPYLFMYYSMPFMAEILPNLDPLSRNLLQKLQKTIDESHGWEYTSAKARARKGLVSRRLVKYLIRPGDVLVNIQGLDTQAYVALKWAEEEPPEDDGDREDYEEYDIARRKKPPKRGSKSQRKGTWKKLRYRWKVPVSSWRFDGCFEMHEEIIIIEMKVAYEDEEVSIDQLSIFPLDFAPKDSRSTLEWRGRMFWKLRHGKFVSYQQDEDGELSNVDERYMVDIETYKKLHPHSKVNELRLRPDLDAKEMADPEPPGGSSILLFPPKIAGYNLLRKKWVNLYVDRMSEITWNKQAFKDLVVGEETKVLVQALVTNQLAAEKSTDSISGKGNGLIILLHGAPGTGKTFTAEGVAEFAEKPLFRVTCGDVGTIAEAVEQYLQSAFHLGKIWDCVVLLDEADVFLEERDMKDLNRNALVSVFLRALEYYNGILILTSNRVGTFDEAFKSRIQLALHYENLTMSQRRKIWQNFVNRLRTFDEPNIDFDDIIDHIDDLSKEDMNGREIRNAITTARQLALFKGTPFCYSHLKHVIGVSGKFGKYLRDLRDGLTDDELKRDGGLRLSYKANVLRDC